jgi:uncharacterized protein YdeI (YjbR/CyaY-like superfamily)
VAEAGQEGIGIVTVTRAEALEEAIRHGWIDGQGASHDESYWLVRFTLRGPRSAWSQINRQTAERLISEQRMQPGRPDLR